MLVKEGWIYQGTHPVNWCPRCETAIADAEVNYEKRIGKLHFIKFPFEQEKGHLLIATTRPEYIPACVTVAINPSDDRFTEYIGKNIVVPLVNRKVKFELQDLKTNRFLISDILFFQEYEIDSTYRIVSFNPNLTNNFGGQGKYFYFYFTSVEFDDPPYQSHATKLGFINIHNKWVKGPFSFFP